MTHITSSSIAGLVVAGVLAGGATPSSAPGHSATQVRTRSVYVSALDKEGMSVTDLQAAEFEVKVGGKTQPIVSSKEATTPLRVSVLVADQGTGAFQLGLARFMQALLGHAEFALTSVIVQPEKIVDFSPDGRVLSEGLSKLGQRGRERGAQLMEAIQDATKAVQHEARRPVILVLRLGGEATTSIQGKDVLEQLRKSGTILYVVSSAGAQGGPPSQQRDGMLKEQAQVADDELAQGIFNLNLVLGDGSRDSGGRHDQVISTTHAQALQRIAHELLHQYEVTYELPDNVKPGDKLSVSSRRKGVSVKAPARLPT